MQKFPKKSSKEVTKINNLDQNKAVLKKSSSWRIIDFWDLPTYLEERL